MNDLETLLEPLVESAPEPPPTAVVRERASRIRRRRRARSGGVTLLVVAALVAGVAVAVPHDRHGLRTIAPAESTTSNTATVAPRPVRVGAPRTLPIFSFDMVSAFGSLWLSQPGRVARFDPGRGRTIATVTVPGASDYRNLAVGAGSVWVDDTGTGTVTRIDPQTNRVVATIPLERGAFDPDGIAFLDGYLWVARPQPTGLYGDIVAIDPATNRIARQSSQTLTPRTFGFVAGSDALWYVGGGAGYELERFDPRTLRTRVTRRGVLGIVGASPGRLWLQVARGVIEIDERSGAQIGPTIRLRLVVNLSSTVANGVLWLAAQRTTIDPGSITPYDARTHRVVGRTVPLSASPPILRLVVTSGTLWIASYATNGLTRIPYSR